MIVCSDACHAVTIHARSQATCKSRISPTLSQICVAHGLRNMWCARCSWRLTQMKMGRSRFKSSSTWYMPRSYSVTQPRPLPRRVPTHQPAAQPRPAPASVASDDVGSVAGDGSVHDMSVGGPSHVGLEATSDALSAASATGDVGFHTLVHAAAAEDEH